MLRVFINKKNCSDAEVMLLQQFANAYIYDKLSSTIKTTKKLSFD